MIDAITSVIVLLILVWSSMCVGYHIGSKELTGLLRELKEDRKGQDDE